MLWQCAALAHLNLSYNDFCEARASLVCALEVVSVCVRVSMVASIIKILADLLSHVQHLTKILVGLS